MTSVRLERVSKRFLSLFAVRDVSLEIAQGEFVTILGASGSGKTTCLRMIAGFIPPSRGRIFFGERDVTTVSAWRRNAAMVFQHYALFPHLTVAQNVAFGLKVRRLNSSEVTARTREALSLVHLDALAERYPAQLSGGQKQRVALARAVVVRPEIILLDEPLAALDAKLREELQIEIKRVQTRLGITTLLVTHDQREALSMSDRVIVMRDGEVLQADTPTDLYQSPKCRYVADFVGRTNLFEAVVRERATDGKGYLLNLCEDSGISVRVTGQTLPKLKEGQRCLVGFRPEAVAIGNQHPNSFRVTVEKAVYLGDRWSVTCTGPGSRSVEISMPLGSQLPEMKSYAAISWSAERSILLEA